MAIPRNDKGEQVCRSCRAPLVFLKTETGKLIPVDKKTVDAADEYFDRDRHVSHFATCPDAKRWRKK